MAAEVEELARLESQVDTDARLERRDRQRQENMEDKRITGQRTSKYSQEFTPSLLPSTLRIYVGK